LMYFTISSCSSCTCVLRSASSGLLGRFTLPLICAGRPRRVRGGGRFDQAGKGRRFALATAPCGGLQTFKSLPEV
jgi:hypothetical protein